MTWIRFFKFSLLVVLLGLPLASRSQDDFSYVAVAERYAETRLDPEAVQEVKMHSFHPALYSS